MAKIVHSTGLSIAGSNCDPNNFSLSVSYADKIVGSATEFAEADSEVVINRITIPKTIKEGSVSITQVQPFPRITLTNLTPETAIFDGYKLTPIAIGEAVVEGEGLIGKKRLRVPFTTAMEYKRVFAGRVAGTFMDAVSEEVFNRFKDKTPGQTTQNLFSNPVYGATAATSSGTINENCVVGDLDFSSLSFSKYGGEYNFPLTLVGPRHFVYAWHVMQSPGASVVFRKPDGSFVDANVSSVFNLGSDCGCGILDRDIVGIPFMKFLPTDYENKLGLKSKRSDLNIDIESPGPLTGVILSHNPSAGLGSARHAQVVGITQITDSTVIFSQPIEEELKAWFSVPYGGDSSSPIYLLWNNKGVVEPILMTQLYTAGSGANFAKMSALIESALGISLTRADISTFVNV